jgi:hypothetical protein
MEEDKGQPVGAKRIEDRTMAFNHNSFAQQCVDQALYFGVNPHYLVAVAQLRSGMADDTQGHLVGPYRLTQEEWNANCSDAEFELDFTSVQITSWRRQCDVFALMTWRTQNRLVSQNGTYPSAVDLYRAQWPNDAVQLPKDLQDALNATAALIGPAAEALLDEPLAPSPIIDDAGTPPELSLPTPKLTKPTSADTLFRSKASSIMTKLMDDFEFTQTQAAGILGNIGHECGGFHEMQERHPSAAGWRRAICSRYLSRIIRKYLKARFLPE